MAPFLLQTTQFLTIIRLLLLRRKINQGGGTQSNPIDVNSLIELAAKRFASSPEKDAIEASRVEMRRQAATLNRDRFELEKKATEHRIALDQSRHEHEKLMREQQMQMNAALIKLLSKK